MALPPTDVAEPAMRDRGTQVSVRSNWKPRVEPSNGLQTVLRACRSLNRCNL